jgi:uncharacterized RDD family membrane protein YckC
VSSPLSTSPSQRDEGAQRDDVVLAGWGIRVAAFLIDGGLVALVATAIAAATGHHLSTVRTGHAKDLGTSPGVLYVNRLTYVALFAYSSILIGSRWSATLGMRLLGIFVVRLDLAPPRLALAIGRSAIICGVGYVLLLAPAVGFAGILVFVDFLWPLWDRRNQTIHDKLACTIVVHGRTGR